MKTLVLFLVSFCSFGAFAAEQTPSEQDTGPLQPRTRIGGFSGAGYSNSVSWTPLIGIDVGLKDSAFSKNEPGNWDGGVQAYFYPNGPIFDSLYLYAGICFLPRHQLSVGFMLGLSSLSLSQLTFGFTAGGQISYELDLSRAWGLSVVPRVSAVSNSLPVPMPIALFLVELRYSMPFKSPRPITK